jgi:DNA-binding GntR family transcriptional regulator
MADPSRLEQSRRNMERFVSACDERDGLAAQDAIQHALLTTLSYLSDVFEKTPDDS